MDMQIMADLNSSAEESGTNYECLGGKGDANCVNCILLKGELLSISLEMKSAHQIIALLLEDINTLKRELVRVSHSTHCKAMIILNKS
jgi:hypothetical protein